MSVLRRFLSLGNRFSLPKFVAAIGFSAILLGIVVMFGWWTHRPTIVQLWENWPTMQINSAVCFVLAGAALLAWVSKNHGRALQFFAISLGLIGTLTSAEYLFHLDLGIDQLLVAPYAGSDMPVPGRMSPVSAFCFLHIAVGLLLAARPQFGRWGIFALGTLASIVISICCVAVLGYVCGLPGTYGWGRLTQVALHTASGMGLIGVALFAISWKAGLREGERTPRWLPIPVGIATAAASLILCAALNGKQSAEITQTVKAGSESVTNQISVRMDARIRSLVRMAHRWAFVGRPKETDWEEDATNYVHDFPDFQALEWIDASHITRWIAPSVNSEALLNLNVVQEERRSKAVAQAAEQREPIVTRPVPLSHGELGFIIYVPIYMGDRFDGWIAGVFKAQPLFDRFLPALVAEGEEIRLSDRHQIFYQRTASPPPPQEEWAIESLVMMHGTDWRVRVWPTPALIKRLDSSLPELVLLAGFIGAALLSATVFLAQRSSAMARETARTNQQLEAALAEVKTLTGLLPICACCKRVRDDTGYWNKIESYITRHSRASFSHGYCPECAVKAFEDWGLDVPDTIRAEHLSKNYE